MSISIFDALADGHRRIPAVAEATGLTQQEAARRLRIAVDEGQVRHSNGYYTLARAHARTVSRPPVAPPAPQPAPVAAVRVRTVLTLTIAGRTVDLDAEDARRLYDELGRALGAPAPRTAAKVDDWGPVIADLRASYPDGATSEQMLALARRHYPAVTARQVSVAMLHHRVVSRTARDGRYDVIPG